MCLKYIQYASKGGFPMEFDNILEEHENQETEATKRFDARMRALIPNLKLPDQLSDDNDYKKPYLILFNAITNALDAMARMNFGRARDILEDAQRNAEEAYISATDEEQD